MRITILYLRILSKYRENNEMTLSIQIDCDRRFFRRYRNDSMTVDLTWSLQLNDLKHEHHRLRI